MNKLQIVRRGFNSRRPFRKLNSVTELAGKDVSVEDETGVIQAEVDNVSVDKDGDATLTLATGDAVTIDSNETEELLETGTVITEDEIPDPVEAVDEVPTEDFEVTREVEDADGSVTEVTTNVEAPTEGDALQKVTLLDSRRKRNSRNYVARSINSRQKNSEGNVDVKYTASGIVLKDIPKSEADRIKSDMKGKERDNEFTWNKDETVLSCAFTNTPMWDLWKKYKETEHLKVPKKIMNDNSPYGFAGEFKKQLGLNCDTKTNSKEFKIARTANTNGKKVRRIASVTAPTLDEAISAVKDKDLKDEIKADGYAELVEKEPESTVQINADVEEVVEEPTLESPETVEDAVAVPETEIKEPVLDADGNPIPTDKVVVKEGEEMPAEGSEVPVEEEVDRTSNSFVGVSAFVSRKYGVKL